jgi:hypothetical protein
VTSADAGKSWTVAHRFIDRSVRRAQWLGMLRAEDEHGNVFLLIGPYVVGSASTDFDRFDMDWIDARAKGTAPPVGPMRCVLDSREGELTIRHGRRGCLHIDEPVLHARWSSTSATIERDEAQAVMSLEAFRAELAPIVEATEGEDDQDGGSTAYQGFEVTWRCGSETHWDAFRGERPGHGRAYAATEALDRAFPSLVPKVPGLPHSP